MRARRSRSSRRSLVRILERQVAGRVERVRERVPAETWIASAPASSSQRQTCTESSTVLPSPSQKRNAFACPRGR